MYKRKQIKCSICNIQKTLAYRSIDKAIKKHGRYLCQSCIQKQPEFSSKNSQRAKKRFQSFEEREKLSHSVKEYYKNNPDVKFKIAKNSKKLWDSIPYKEKRSQQTQELWNKKHYRQKVINNLKNSWTEDRKISQSNITKNLWKDPNYILKHDIGTKCSLTPERREQLSKTTKALWKSDDYKRKHAKSMATISNSILDKIVINTAIGLGYKAFPAAIGPWTFDALIINDLGKDLLVECQGDYYHNKPERILRDKQKLTYFNRHLSKNYDLLIIWKHEFYCIGKIIELLENKLKTPIVPFDYNLHDLKIKLIPSNEIKPFFDQYHYLRKHRNGPINIAALLNDEIIAAISYGNPTRQNSSKRLNLKNSELLELTRLCIHPKYRKKNLGSYLLSKSIKWITNNCKSPKAIITFADTTLGHQGTVYKASNFQFDGEVKPTYWYVDSTGHYRHKKTVWDQSRRLGMTEQEYANYCNLLKIKGKKLLRFIYWL